jgi:hypothetical protein
MTFLAFTGLTLGTAIISSALFSAIVLFITYWETRK